MLWVSLPKKIPEDFEGVVAAEIVATTAALFVQLTGTQPSQDTINALAFQAHKKIYPQASGLYTSLSSFGGLIYYRREFEFLKGIYKLPYKIPNHIQQKLFINFTQAADIYATEPKNADALLAEQEKRTKRAMVAIIKEDAALFFGQFPPMNEKNYQFSQSFDGVTAA
ncbi:MAG: hypothetical protein UZ22_OP11002000772 [Microgenomates bacterium OLB23]|nr:MAG: hypothetical protein UZ22_OP11002000772 [Microgenomates bacterium OLB23]